MPSQLTTDDQALRLFFTEDIYLVAEAHGEAVALIKDVAGVPAPVVEPEVISIQETVTREAPAVAPVYKALGNNKRNILILVRDPQNEVSDEKGRELLRKIVKSINLTANDFALLNYAGYANTSLGQLKAHFSSELVFSFGIPAAELGLSPHPENTVVVHEGTRIVFSAGLPQLDADPNGKKLLWGCLKQLGL